MNKEEKQITVNEIINKLEKGELENPSILSDYVVILSASLYTGGKLELATDIEYSRKWSGLRVECKTDKECDMKCKLTEEYKTAKLAQIANKTILHTIQALKKKLQNLSDELRSAQNY